MKIYVSVCDPDFNLDKFKECISDCKFRHSVENNQADLQFNSHRVIVIDITYYDNPIEIDKVLSHFACRILKLFKCSTLIGTHINYNCWILAGGVIHHYMRDPFKKKEPVKKPNPLGLKIIKGGL